MPSGASRGGGKRACASRARPPPQTTPHEPASMTGSMAISFLFLFFSSQGRGRVRDMAVDVHCASPAGAGSGAWSIRAIAERGVGGWCVQDPLRVPRGTNTRHRAGRPRRRARAPWTQGRTDTPAGGIVPPPRRISLFFRLAPAAAPTRSTVAPPPPAHTARRPRCPPHTDEPPPYGYELARPNHGLPTTKAVPCGAQPASRPTAPPPPPPCSPTLHPRGGTCTSTHSGHRLLPGRPALPRDVIDPADGTAAGRGCGAWGAERAGADCAQAGVWRRVGR